LQKPILGKHRKEHVMESDFSVLFQPIEIGRGKKKLRLKNRFIMSPMVSFMPNGLGEVTRRMVDYYVERAKGGVGTIIVESMNIDGKITFGRLGIFHDRFINELEYLASSIKEHGARAFGQINQPGIRGDLPGPDDLSAKEIADLIEAYAAAAERLKRAEFDGVEIHGAHGYLISQFLSPPTNHRKDGYGGDPDRRARFALEVIKAVRQAVGEDFPIGFRMNGDDYIEGGVRIDDAKFIAQRAQAAGVDVIHVSAGVGIVAHDLSLGDNKSYGYLVQPMALPRGCLVHLAAAVKKVVKVPVVTVGRINAPCLARDILTNGKADLVAMGRQLIADPHFVKKVSEGRIEDIRQCIACMYCHGKRMRATKRLQCAINPWAGRETELRDIRQADVSKDVMIVGGGPGGMEAARWLSKRGHRPAIHEKDDRLGGQLLLSCLPPHKEEVNRFREYLVKQIGKMGIEVNLMTEVTPESVLKKMPGALIIATGAKQAKPDMPIDKRMPCLYAWDVISGKEEISGGWSCGCGDC
jgi:2,4-dienoyl-CoA reductase-like NADH-dependent reductase (Old Yellow Enzyme family)